MAGIGVRLKRIYEKQTLVAHLVGFAYSIMVTIAPMLVVIGTVMLMSIVLGYDQVGYARRGLFAGTILYIFIFSLLTAAPFNAVLSRYMSDVIYEEKYENILPWYAVESDFKLCSWHSVLYLGTSGRRCQSAVRIYRILWIHIACTCILFDALFVNL